jgi:hypothetical protein
MRVVKFWKCLKLLKDAWEGSVTDHMRWEDVWLSWQASIAKNVGWRALVGWWNFHSLIDLQVIEGVREGACDWAGWLRSISEASDAKHVERWALVGWWNFHSLIVLQVIEGVREGACDWAGWLKSISEASDAKNVERWALVGWCSFHSLIVLQVFEHERRVYENRISLGTLITAEMKGV